MAHTCSGLALISIWECSSFIGRASLLGGSTCLMVGRVSKVAIPSLGGRAGSDLTLLRTVHTARNDRSILLFGGKYVPQSTKLVEELRRRSLPHRPVNNGKREGRS